MPAQLARPWLTVCLLISGLLGAVACSADVPGAASTASASAVAAAAPTADSPASEAEERPRVRIETTLGNIEIEFFAKEAPVTTAHILKLVDDGFYDGLIFHRVVAGFVIQAGGFTRDMTPREPPGTVINESFNGLSNRKGTLAMARVDHPDSADSQWFINVKNNGRLDAKRRKPGYTVFAQVTSGWETITAIELTNTILRNGMAGVPESPIEILKMARY